LAKVFGEDGVVVCIDRTVFVQIVEQVSAAEGVGKEEQIRVVDEAVAVKVAANNANYLQRAVDGGSGWLACAKDELLPAEFALADLEVLDVEV
jgi:hypothetical protein